ncbi:MAG: ATP-binding protein [Bacteroidota bacterium]
MLDEKGDVWQIDDIFGDSKNTKPTFLRTVNIGNEKIYHVSENNIITFGNDKLDYLKIDENSCKSIEIDHGYSYGFHSFSENESILLAQNNIYDLFEVQDSLFYRIRSRKYEDEKWDLTTLFELGESQIAIPVATTNLVLFNVENTDLIPVDTFHIGFQMFAAFKASDGSIYVGTNAGIFVCDESGVRPLRNDFINIGDLRIHSIQESEDAIVWFATSEGILSYSPFDSTFRLFSEADGVHSLNYLDQEALYKDDKIVFFAKEGFVSFKPKNIKEKNSKLQPYISNTWINNIPKESSSFTSFVSSLVLPYTESSVRLRINVFSPFQSERDAIYYQLKGFEDYYTKINIGEDANYTKLDPGKYNLHVFAMNRHGIREGELYLPITIRPPYWQTLWFKIAVGFGVLLIIGGIYMALLRPEIAKQTRLREQQARLAAERDRIAGEVHDDLGGQLSSILFLSEGLSYEENIPQDVKPQLSRIHELSKSSLQNVRDIIFALDNRRSSLSDLIGRLEQAGADFFSDRDMTFNCRNDLVDIDFDLSSRQKRDLTLIVKEAFHNVFKHAEASWVQLKIEQKTGHIQFQISDDGKGFQLQQESDYPTSGYGLENMREKANRIGATLDIQSQLGEGTTLSLSYPIPTE